MSNARHKVFCQNCRAANLMSRELCVQCGMRLMLIATSAVARHEDSAARHIHEEHLLERISVLENHLAQLTDKVSQTLDLLLRQARTAHLDQTLLESLIDVLGQSHLIDGRELQATWHRRSNGEKTITEPIGKIWQFARENIITEYRGEQLDEFARQVNEAIDLIAQGKLSQAATAFDKAALLDASNNQLNFVIGRLLFAAQQLASARNCLERTLLADPRHARAALLLGLIAAETGELQKAETLLADSLRCERKIFAAHCARGLLRILQGDWKLALPDFKRAHALKPGAASLFLLGFAHYHGGDYRSALKSLERASVLEPEQAVIAYLRGIVLLKFRERNYAQEWFKLSSKLDPRCPLYRAAARRPSLKTASPPELFTGPRSKPRLKLSERAKFIADAIFEDAVETNNRRTEKPLTATTD